MAAELARNPPHFAFGVRQHGPIVLRLLHFVGRPRLCETLLQVVERLGAHSTALPAKDHESHRTIELGNFRSCQRARDFFRETEPRDAATLTVPLLDIVVDLDFAVANRDMIRQAIESLPDFRWNECVSADRKAGRPEIVHRADFPELLFVQSDELGQTQTLRLAA